MKSKEKEFLDLIAKHQKIIHKVCHLYTDNQDDHEDLFQEILLQLWQGYPRFKGDAKVTTWMYRVSLYTAISSIKKKHKRKEEAIYIQEQEQIEKTDPYEFENLRAAIDTLSETDKALVMLYLEEKSYKETADIMGMTESNVGVKLNRIKKKLKEILIAQ
ncbi:RNA polymerase ECF-type sigma factor [Fulvivirga imtechensis AK7]|uniref:RNA polymerase ECF-type sigma factor n=1 Tax=Fulvivirga imtechensis AK7 TaxID=1237149 RepID=L8JKF1_9BACT|nr:RNA polymerase sigma factor [Fulvivirga imtechensis]ELR69250.1 RNA polymerase ECF-type sigma factor [Fulvivirga imtechensis AK7]